MIIVIIRSIICEGSELWLRYTLIRIQYFIGIYDDDANGGYLHCTRRDNVLRFVKTIIISC